MIYQITLSIKHISTIIMSSPASIPKYKFINGIMRLNPDFVAQGGQSSTVAQPNQALAILSSTDDVMKVNFTYPNRPVQLSESTTASMEIMQEPGYVQSLGRGVDAGSLLDDVTKVFGRYEIPLGLLNKLLALTDCELYFILDDSTSMTGTSDVLVKDCSSWMKNKLANKNGNYAMSRWEECEDRLHILGEILPYIPIKTIKFVFLNRSDDFSTIRKEGQSLQEYETIFHQQIASMFQRHYGGGTPLYTKIKQAIDTTGSMKRMIYVLTDGEPNDASKSKISELITNRKNPSNTPISLLSCSDNNDDTDWLKEVEEVADFCSELDDFLSERKEVEKDQGPVFPFSRGFWILCMLVAAINPDDLDALDESTPFTRGTLGNLLGRVLSNEEYQDYWSKHPKARDYNSHFSQFMREDIVARQIIPKKVAAKKSSWF